MAQAHGFGVGFPGEIGIGRNRLKDLARLGGLAVVFGNQFLLKVHRGNLLCCEASINQDRPKREEKATNCRNVRGQARSYLPSPPLAARNRSMNLVSNSPARKPGSAKIA